MPSIHHTGEHWHLHAPFLRDSAGGYITLPIARPSFNWIVFIIGFAHATDVALTFFQVQHHMAVVFVSHTMSVLLARAASAGLARRRLDDRALRLFTVLVGLTGFAIPANTSRISIPAMFVGAGVVLTLINELGFRLARCRKCTSADEKV